ncbi:hypothetical protein NLI96_g9781 [Meripilus lineatus]|uniref:non-specific serine/threonine protein kinase n=1 Tax=Meripilus lineatus TaxID=2056292 RepID=A0AAD5UWH3_9APHY|nr:hypothetical protein NLI96_g9781 [Physisporinus lineatus]
MRVLLLPKIGREDDDGGKRRIGRPPPSLFDISPLTSTTTIDFKNSTYRRNSDVRSLKPRRRLRNCLRSKGCPQETEGTQNNSDNTGGTVAPKRSIQVKDNSRITAKPKLADFHLLKCLGEGSYGTVHLSQHKPSGLTVALKAISKVPRIDECGSRNLGTKALERRLKRRAGDDTQWVNEVSNNEIVALLRVAGERSLLQPFAFFHDLRYFYIATPFYSGGDLATILDKGSLPIHVTRSIAADVLIGLQALFKHGIVHHDIKPANILIDADNHAILADFGLATLFAKGMFKGEKKYHSREELDRMMGCREKAFLRVGTDPYIAPEVWDGHGEHSYPADVWPFGVTVFQMLTGRLPWDIYLPDQPEQEGEQGEDIVTIPDPCADDPGDDLDPNLDNNGDEDDEGDKGDEELVELIRSAPIVLTDEENERLGIDAVTEDFYLNAMDRNPLTRPTPAELMAHPFFTNVNFDWTNHSKMAVLPDWRPCVSDDSDKADPDPQAGGSVLNNTRPLLPREDKFPHFSYLSPLLAAHRPSSLATNSTSVQRADVPSGTFLETSLTPTPVCSDTGTAVVDPSPLATTSSATTLVGSPMSSDPKDISADPSGAVPPGEEDPLTTKAKEESDTISTESDDAPSDASESLDLDTSLVAGVFNKIKTWVQNVWEGVKTWVGWT